MKRMLIVKDSKTKVSIFDSYLNIKNNQNDQIISFRNIDELYLNKLIEIFPKDLIKLAKYMSVSFINQYGLVLAKVELENENI